MVPVRSHTPKELIYQFHELAERLSALGCGDISPPLIADVRALKIQCIVRLERETRITTLKKGPK